MAAETKRTTTAKERAEHAKKDARKVHEGSPFVSVEQHRYMNHLATGLRGVARGSTPTRSRAWCAGLCSTCTRTRTPAVPLALVGGRLFPYPKNDEAHARAPPAPSSTRPTRETKDTSWTGAISKLLQALTHNPEDLGLHFQVFRKHGGPSRVEALARAIAENRVGRALHRAGEPGIVSGRSPRTTACRSWRARVLYYKHTQQRSSGFLHAHVRLNPRAAQAARYFDCGTPAAELRVVYKGNSSARILRRAVRLADGRRRRFPARGGRLRRRGGGAADQAGRRRPRSHPQSRTRRGTRSSRRSRRASLPPRSAAASSSRRTPRLLRDNKRMKAMIMASMGDA